MEKGLIDIHICTRDRPETFIYILSPYYIMYKICDECKIEFKTYYPTQRFCSNNCKWKAPIYKEKAREMAKNNIGKHCHSEEWKEHLRKRFLGKNNPSKRPEVREKIRSKIIWMHKNDEVYKKKCRETNHLKSLPLEKNPNWKNGATKEWMKFRAHISSKLIKWSREVKIRDNYQCVKCTSKDRVEADHKKPVRDYPELVLDLNNGQTLCYKCHRVKTSNMLKKVQRGEI